MFYARKQIGTLCTFHIITRKMYELTKKIFMKKNTDGKNQDWWERFKYAFFHIK